MVHYVGDVDNGMPNPLSPVAAPPNETQARGLVPPGFRGGYWIFLAILGSVTFTIPALFLTIVLAIPGDDFEGRMLPTALRIVLPVLFAIGILFSLRLARVRVVVSPAELVIVNVTRTLRFRWADIQQVQLDRQSTQSPRNSSTAVARVMVVTRRDLRFTATGSTCYWTSRDIKLAPLLTQIIAHGVPVFDDTRR